MYAPLDGNNITPFFFHQEVFRFLVIVITENTHTHTPG